MKNAKLLMLTDWMMCNRHYEIIQKILEFCSVPCNTRQGIRLFSDQQDSVATFARIFEINFQRVFLIKGPVTQIQNSCIVIPNTMLPSHRLTHV